MTETADVIYGRHPDWVTGQISLPDARYLSERVIKRGADTVVELGTASGVSTAILCHALASSRTRRNADDDYRVLSYDSSSTFYADRSKRVGGAVDAMLEHEVARHIEFRNPAIALDLRDFHARHELEFLFIDADHRHPWPTLDLIAAIPVLRPGAEIVLHDINLPVVKPEFADWGAKYLFDALDVEKYFDEAVDPPNIGSVIVPDEIEPLEEALVALIAAHEWETDIPDRVRSALLA
jgi:predicted O-methyltransferase YrrM